MKKFSTLICASLAASLVCLPASEAVAEETCLWDTTGWEWDAATQQYLGDGEIRCELNDDWWHIDLYACYYVMHDPAAGRVGQYPQYQQYFPRCDLDGDGIFEWSEVLEIWEHCGLCPPCPDADADGVCDADDGCPTDANKVEPGLCGCGEAEGTCAGTCPWDTTGTPNYDKGIYEGDGYVHYNDIEPWYMSDVWACYYVMDDPDAGHVGPYVRYQHYFPRCDIDNDGIFEWSEVLDIYYNQGPCECEPNSNACDDAGAMCGEVDDGCGNPVSCGGCVAPEVCEGGTCVCHSNPNACADAGALCGQVDDGCGNTVDCEDTCTPGFQVCQDTTCFDCNPHLACGPRECGTALDDCGVPMPCCLMPAGTACCESNETCDDVTGMCVCVPNPNACADAGAQCGQVDDGCGTMVDCENSCDSLTQMCDGNACVDCQGQAACGARVCGTVVDNCGNVLSCDTIICLTQCVDGICVCDPNPNVCADYGYECGTIIDNCGNMVPCGACGPGCVCGDGICLGLEGPMACAGRECGPAVDSCGHTVDCGSCTPDSHCTPDGLCADVPNPNACADAGAECGMVNDGLGGMVDCGSCDDGFQCQGITCVECEGVAACGSRECGIVVDNCGSAVQCGACGPGIPGCECQDGMCPCCPDPNACANSGAECGLVEDGCGTYADCGSCAAGEVCEDNACVPNVVSDCTCDAGCAAGEYCNRSAADGTPACSAEGVCTPIPTSCPPPDPDNPEIFCVCSFSQTVYTTNCEAEIAGESVWKDGQPCIPFCDDDAGCPPDYECAGEILKTCTPRVDGPCSQ